MLDLLLYILGLIKDLEPTVLYDDDKIAIVQELEPYEDTEDMEVSLGLLNYYCYKKDVDFDQNRHVITASIISGNDLDFLATLNQENGLFSPDRFHGYNTNGTGDYGFCGLNSAYHWDFINSEEFKDPALQLKYCYNIFKDRPYRFYGYFVRENSYDKFQCPITK